MKRLLTLMDLLQVILLILPVFQSTSLSIDSKIRRVDYGYESIISYCIILIYVTACLSLNWKTLKNDLQTSDSPHRHLYLRKRIILIGIIFTLITIFAFWQTTSYQENYPGVGLIISAIIGIISYVLTQKYHRSLLNNI